MTLRTTLAAALAGLTLLAGTAAQADGFRTTPPRPEDVRALRACLGIEKPAADRQHCIGMLTDPCQAAPDGQSTMGAEMCQSHEYAAWDAILNETYRQAIKRFDEPGKAYLREVQTAWIAFRDLSCEWSSKVFPHGTIAGPLTGRCLIEETAHRTITLLDVAEWLEPH